MSAHRSNPHQGATSPTFDPSFSVATPAASTFPSSAYPSNTPAPIPLEALFGDTPVSSPVGSPIEPVLLQSPQTLFIHHEETSPASGALSNGQPQSASSSNSTRRTASSISSTIAKFDDIAIEETRKAAIPMRHHRRETSGGSHIPPLTPTASNTSPQQQQQSPQQQQPTIHEDSAVDPITHVTIQAPSPILSVSPAPTAPVAVAMTIRRGSAMVRRTSHMGGSGTVIFHRGSRVGSIDDENPSPMFHQDPDPTTMERSSSLGVVVIPHSRPTSMGEILNLGSVHEAGEQSPNYSANDTPYDHVKQQRHSHDGVAAGPIPIPSPTPPIPETIAALVIDDNGESSQQASASPPMVASQLKSAVVDAALAQVTDDANAIVHLVIAPGSPAIVPGSQKKAVIPPFPMQSGMQPMMQHPQPISHFAPLGAPLFDTRNSLSVNNGTSSNSASASATPERRSSANAAPTSSTRTMNGTNLAQPLHPSSGSGSNTPGNLSSPPSRRGTPPPIPPRVVSPSPIPISLSASPSRSNTPPPQQFTGTGSNMASPNSDNVFKPPVPPRPASSTHLLNLIRSSTPTHASMASGGSVSNMTSSPAGLGAPSAGSRQSSGAPVRGLDEDDPTSSTSPGPPTASSPSSSMTDPTRSASSPPEETLSPSTLTELTTISTTTHTSPIPIPPPYGHFTSAEWSWSQIDYVTRHHAMLTDLFHAIEIYSRVNVDKWKEQQLVAGPSAAATAKELANASNAATSPSSTSSTSSNSEKPPLPTPAPSRREGGALSSARAAAQLASNFLSSFSTTLVSPRASMNPNNSSSSALSQRTASLGATPQAMNAFTSTNIPPLTAELVASPSFQPHDLDSLTLIAEKELLRKTKIVSGPLLGLMNPTEQLVTQMLTKNGSALSSGPTKSLSSGTSTPPIQGSSSSSSVPSHNHIPHLRKLNIQMGIEGRSLSEGLRKNHTLTHLGLSHNVIAEKGCAEICKSLQQHPKLLTLVLSQNILYPQCGAALRDLLLYNRILTQLDVSINKLAGDGIAVLVEALGATKANRAIFKESVQKNTSFGGSSISSSSASSSAAMIGGGIGAGSSMSGAGILTTSGNSTTSAAGRSRNGSPTRTTNKSRGSSPVRTSARSGSPRVGSVGHHTPSQSVSISSSAASSFAQALGLTASSSSSSTAQPSAAAVSSAVAAGGAGVAYPAFTPSFSVNQTLTSLDLSNNRTGGELDALCSALVCSNSRLIDLKMNLNDIGDVGAHYFSLALRHPHCSLRSLSLNDNTIGPYGCKILMQAIEQNQTLTSLDLSWNHLGQSGLGEGPKSVGKMLSVNTTLETLILVSNGINEAGMKAIVTGWNECVVRGNSALTHLDLSVNVQVGGEGTRELCAVLSQPLCRLHTLNLNRCGLGDEAILSLLPFFPLNHHLVRLLLHGNHQLRLETCQALLAAYTHSPSLVELDVDDSPLIARDTQLAKDYRRIRAKKYANVLESACDMPIVLGEVIAEYALDLRRRHVQTPAPKEGGVD